MTIEMLTRVAGVVGVTRLMTIEMLTRVAGVVGVTRLMTIEMLTRVAGVIGVTRLMTIEMLTRVAGVIGVTRLMTTKMLHRGDEPYKPGSKHLWGEKGFVTVGMPTLDFSAHRSETGAEPSSDMEPVA